MKWWWIPAALAVYMLVKDPVGLAHVWHQAVNWLQSAGQSAATFVNSL